MHGRGVLKMRGRRQSMRPDLESRNIPKQQMRGFTREEIKCWGCQAPFCGHRIMSLVDGKALAVCSLREASREVLGMVRSDVLDHDYSADELEGHARKDLACNNCKGRSCGYKGMRTVEGRPMRVCLLGDDAKRIFGVGYTNGHQYIDGQGYRLGL